MKKLDLYIIKSFLKPFFATFFVILFVLVLQAVWVGFDKISGKGVDMGFILRFVGYLALTVVPMALPIGILLSSIMALGNFGENYEFAAVKSAGISLRRFMMPIVIFTVFLSGINFLFLNNIYPHAMLKQKNMYNNMKKKQPALALIPRVFNTEIPGYTIKFDEQYGEKKQFLTNVHINDLSSNLGKIKNITAKNGEIITEEDSKYMTLLLKDGNYYEENSNRRDSKEKRAKMPASKATFKEYSINIDVSSFSDEGIDDINFKNGYQMLSLSQLKIFSDSTNTTYSKYIEQKAKTFFTTLGGPKLKPYNDTLPKYTLNDTILKNYILNDKIAVLSNSVQSINRELENVNSMIKGYKFRRKVLNLYDYEYHYRITFSLSCLVLFFIGAPLGSIIRKGGFGLPMVFAITIFLVYFFTTQFGKNLAEESAMTASIGGWLSTFLLLPFGILLTRRAAKDKGLFDISSFFHNIKNFFSKFRIKKSN